jgi:hypothetical protein
MGDARRIEEVRRFFLAAEKQLSCFEHAGGWVATYTGGLREVRTAARCTM